MANKTHHGGKVGQAAAILADKKSSPAKKSDAGKIMADHKKKYH